MTYHYKYAIIACKSKTTCGLQWYDNTVSQFHTKLMYKPKMP